jgi:membrane protein
MNADVRQLLRGVVDQFAKHDLLTYSSAIAFQALYAVVPLASVVLAMFGLVGAQSLYTHHIAPVLKRDLSQQAYEIANRTAMHVMNQERYFWVTLGLFVTLWGIGAALRSMMTPLNRVYGARETRSWANRLLVSVGAGAAVVILLGGAVACVLLGRLLNPHGVLAVPVFLGRWLAALVLMLASIAVVLRFVPAKSRPLRWISLGSTLCIVCWIGASVGFGAYISFVSYTSYYGALAGIVLLLIYLHISTIALLLGVSVDARVRQLAQSGTSRRGRARTRAGT